MNIRHCSLLLFSLLVLINCQKSSVDESAETPKENEPIEEIARETYFSYSSSPPLNPDQEIENWIITHNAKGEILNFKKFIQGDSFSLETSSDSLTPKISATYLTIEKVNNMEIFNLSTFTDLQKGHFEDRINKWQPTEIPPQTSEFEVTIKNLPITEDYGLNPVKISSEIGRLGGSSSSKVYSNGLRETNFLDVPKYEGLDSYFISVIDDFNILKFCQIDNPSGENIELDYNTHFSEPDKDISLPLPPHENFLLNIAGFKANQDFGEFSEGALFIDIISQVNTNVSTNPLRAGYSDNFEKFRTQFRIDFIDYSYGIFKYGDALESIEIMEKPKLTILDDSIYNFKWEIDISTFIKSVHFWKLPSITLTDGTTIIGNWTITNPQETTVIQGKIPQEILEKYPNLSIEELKYTRSSFDFEVPGGLYKSREFVTLMAP
ncbi:hypothetical protein [Cytophaga sp. FL35]|uniref:hypothetical protein n=1 Tax=Cytophaga sp. FL35 TaxID=1904456 RepID=UPI001653A944|nr:hypothetical protein [Cytophaga sp. FL35]MBC6997429.1 hypothetical protein [Cytophaga sp. FL35]